MQYIPGRFVYRDTGQTSYCRVFLCASSGAYFSGYEWVNGAYFVLGPQIWLLDYEVFEPFTRIEESRDASTGDLH